MDEIVVLYLVHNGNDYRIKVFVNTIGVERQNPREGNVLFSRSEHDVYIESRNSWYLYRLPVLIAAYEAHIADVNAKLDMEDN